MKYGSFSDAIRAGAALRPQAFGLLRRREATCAIAAGLDAMGDYDLICDREYNFVRRVREPFPYMKERAECPVAGCEQVPKRLRDMIGVVVHLNDDHRWTREAIADWLRSEEDKLGYITLSEVETAPQTAPAPVPACVG